jgi:hypothetical protein
MVQLDFFGLGQSLVGQRTYVITDAIDPVGGRADFNIVQQGAENMELASFGLDCFFPATTANEAQGCQNYWD